MKRILFFIALMLSNFPIFGTYNLGSLNTVANGGQGFGDELQGYLTNESATFYGSCVRSDGSIVAVGQTSGSFPCLYVYNADGSIDTTFNDGAGNLVLNSGSYGVGYATSFLSNGDIIVVGFAGDQYLLWQVINQGPDITVNVQANVIDGSIDFANAVLYDGNQYIYVIGTTAQPGNPTAIFIAQYNTSGNLQTTYNSGAVVGGGGGSAITQAGIALFSLASVDLIPLGASFDNNGNIVVVGSYAGTSGVLCRFTPDGLLDTTFANAGYMTVENVILQDVGVQSGRSSNSIVACGTSTTNRMVVNRFDANATTAPTTFTSVCGVTGASAKSLVIDLNDTIVIGGTAVIAEENNFLIARLNPTADAFDITFGTGGYTIDISGGQGSCLLSSGTSTSTNYILAGYNGTNTGIIAEYLGDLAKGIIDRSFGTAGGLQVAGGLTSSPEAIMVTNSGDLIVGVESSRQLVGLRSDYALVFRLNYHPI
jgi:uncharacterized delta-60 repeat protein